MTATKILCVRRWKSDGRTDLFPLARCVDTLMTHGVEKMTPTETVNRLMAGEKLQTRCAWYFLSEAVADEPIKCEAKPIIGWGGQEVREEVAKWIDVR